MSPRRNRRAPEAGRVGAYGGPQQTEEGPDGQWVVRPVAGAAKAYRCPGCDQEIPPGAEHIVAWPADAGSVADRRHWHRPCWNHRLTRRPRVRRR